MIIYMDKTAFLVEITGNICYNKTNYPVEGTLVEERFDIYDKNRIKTGKTMLRGEKAGGEWLRTVVHICVINSQGKMLIQQRQSFKKSWSGMWDISVGGGVLAGESPCEAARRELREEIGLEIDFSALRPSFTVNFSKGFDDYFIVQRDVELSELVLQQEEVQAVRWADCDEIFRMIDSGEFIPYHKSLIQLMFDMKDHSDARSKAEAG